jgi:hypothetical protein
LPALPFCADAATKWRNADEDFEQEIAAGHISRLSKASANVEPRRPPKISEMIRHCSRNDSMECRKKRIAPFLATAYASWPSKENSRICEDVWII